MDPLWLGFSGLKILLNLVCHPKFQIGLQYFKIVLNHQPVFESMLKWNEGQ